MKTFLGVNEAGFVNDVFYQNSEDREPPEGFYEAPAEQFFMIKRDFENNCWTEGLTKEEIERIKEENEGSQTEEENMKARTLDLQRVCNLLMNQP
ncbi:hypothetical protein [Bacillus amyloliquefaciens]|uniref:hypothetical protein n=1 Tax=Bacillus amyloliquefaciens TaxID=1390 RepID=UPI000E26AA0F|nr:hypothetical protein [Bacillus amyloliquefaciens]RDY83893.1 hypothetical protein C3733_18700 [Bacillus amyloliquefaciens]